MPRREPDLSRKIVGVNVRPCQVGYVDPLRKPLSREAPIEQTCDRCHARMFTVRKSPHPKPCARKVLAMYECPKCGQLGECVENGEIECVDMNP
jgi:hypothetical protein